MRNEHQNRESAESAKMGLKKSSDRTGRPETEERPKHPLATDPHKNERQECVHLQLERQRPQYIHNRFGVGEVLNQQKVRRDPDFSGQ